MNRFALTSILSFLFVAAASAADVQMNQPDNNSPSRGNSTTQSETNHVSTPDAIMASWNDSHDFAIHGTMFTSFSSWGYSANGGMNFTDAGLFPAPAGWSGLGDPAVVADSSGNFYVGSLATADFGMTIGGVTVSRASASSAPTLDTPVLLTPLTAGDNFDKELMAVDRSGGSHDGRVYLAMSEGDFGIFCSPPAVNLVIAHSTSNSPLAFSSWQSLTTTTSGVLNHGANPVVGPNGELYVAWGRFVYTGCSITGETIQIVKSTDGGATFTQPNGSPGILTITTPNFTAPTFGSGSSTTRTRSFPYLAVDTTPVGSPTRGNLYLVYQAIPKLSGPDKSDIYFTRSTDGGQTWLPPRSINTAPAVTLNPDTTTNDNWQPAITVSPVNGHIYVSFFDRRNDPADVSTRVYRALSTDGGLTWNNAQLSSASFVPSTGYDPDTVSTYFGDYNWATADSNGLQFSWGDSRNLCAPPAGAASPCSPTGRGDQDAFFTSVPNLGGPDLFIQPWGYVTGIGPLWETPDIYVVDSGGTHVNAFKGIVNKLRAQVRNLGNTAATGVVVIFKYAPANVGVPDADFEQIGTATINVAAAGNSGDTVVVPINWDLSNLSHTHAGWPGPIGNYEHFCVRVWVQYPADVNMSNNYAQNNFFDVTTASGTGMSPISTNLMLGAGLDRAALAHVVVSPLPEGFNVDLKVQGVAKDFSTFPPSFKINPGILASSAVLHPVADAVKRKLRAPKVESVDKGFVLAAREIRPAAFTFARPAAYQGKEDVVADVSLVVDGKPVSGVSLLLYKAPGPGPDLNGLPARTKPIELPAVRRMAALAVHAADVSAAGARAIANAEPPMQTIPPGVKYRRTFTADYDKTFAALTAVSKARKLAHLFADPKRGLVNTAAVTVSAGQLRSLVTAEDAKRLVGEGQGKYMLSIWVAPAGAGKTEVGVDALIQVDSILDSPMGQRLHSNGTLEQGYLDALTQTLK